MRILLIEDDRELSEFISQSLKQAGYDTDVCYDGEDGLYYMIQNSYDIVLLDRMLPRMDGIAMLKEARKKGVTSPVLFITAMNQVIDRVDGLDAGADDYLIKPFDLRELLARIRALVRRPQALADSENLNFKDLTLSVDELTLRGNQGECRLSKKEAELLEVFFRNAGKTLSREFLFGHIWGMAEVEEASLDIYIHFLRRHLRAASDKATIKTLRKVGYSLVDRDD